MNNAYNTLKDSLTRYESRHNGLSVEVLEAEVINLACLEILQKSKNNDNSDSRSNEDIANGYIAAGMSMFPNHYNQSLGSIAMGQILQNIGWPGMWAFLCNYFQEKHGLDIIEENDITEENKISKRFDSTLFERYENGLFIIKSNTERIVKVTLSEDKRQMLVSIEPSLSPKEAVLHSELENDEHIYKGKDPDFQFTVMYNKFDQIKEFVMERLDTGLKLRYLE